MLNVAFIFFLSIPSLVFSNSLFYDPYYIRYLLIGLTIAALCPAYIRSKTGDCIRMRNCKTDIPASLWIFFAYVTVIGVLRITTFSDLIDGVATIALMIAVYGFASYFSLRLKYILIAANIAGVAHIIIAHLQFYGLSKGLPWIMPVELFKGYSVIGNIGYRGLLGIFISLCVVNSVYLAATAQRTIGRIFHIMMIFVFISSVLSIGGRTSLIAIPPAFIPWGIYYRIEILAFLKKRKRVVAISLLIVSFLFAITLRNSDIIKRMTLLGRDTSSMLRLSHYATSLFMIRENPLFGVGIGNYKFHYLEAQKTMKERFSYAARLPWTYTYWAHNEYLQFVAEFGVPALFALVVIAFVWFRNIWKAMKDAKRAPPDKVWGMSIILVFLVSSLFERPFHQIEVCLWFPLACAIIKTHVEGNSDTCKKCGLSVPAIIVVLAAGVCIYVHGAFGQHALRQAYDTSDMATAYEYLEKAKAPLLTRDEARICKNTLVISFFSKTGNRQGLDASLDAAYDLFRRYPTSETYVTVRNNAIRYNRVDLFRKLQPILPSKPIG